jgi:ubiquitin fusion degradation protein 1
MFHNPFSRFSEHYRCYSIALLPGNERENVNYGGKIILPPSALAKLSLLNIEYPMLFQLVNEKSSTNTHCGVLEFIADEGRVYLPKWVSSF